MFAEGTIRLTNGNDTFGRVEIFLDNQWGTICDDGWEFIDAIVVCWQLGFKTANIATSGNFPNNAPGVIHFENLNSHGKEESILECRFRTNHDCSDFEAVDVGCAD
ncbi:Neurotrypsin [Holothuria leucospilota]|uniref:Neurotrypsin n=1 Tax=Holothuria leucospilota TaxID=206669 RepID=A0A9Q0YPA5_HOLLE|nr:Neurotrypsin [Holothuria leucospilota]